MDNLTLDQQPQGLSINPDTSLQPVSPDVAVTRANKFEMGLQDVNPGMSASDYIPRLVGGEEPQIRRDAATKLDDKRASAARDQVMDYIQKGNSAEGLQNILHDAALTTDPDSVMEERFAYAYLDKLNWTSPRTPTDGFWFDANQNWPEAQAASMATGQSALSYRDYAVKLREDVEQDINNLKDSWSGTATLGAHYLFAGVQPYRELAYRTLVPGPGSFALGSGDVIKQKANSLYDLPFDEYKTQLNSIKDTLTQENPLLAAEFLDNVIGVPTSETKLNNLFSMMEAPTAFGIARGAVRMGRGAIVMRQVNTAIKTAIEDMKAVKDNPPQVVAPAAAGDLDQASTERLAMEVNKGLSGQANPVEDALNDLPQAQRLDRDASMADPGALGATMSNSVKERYNTFIDKLMNTTAQILQVERIPDWLAVKKAVAQVKDSMRDIFKGFSVLDVGDPEWNSTTNTYHVPFHLGADGDYFTSPNQAWNYAESLGIKMRDESLLNQVNRYFGEESSRITKSINDLKAEIKAGPARDADVNEMNRHAVTLPQKLKELEGKFDDLLAWHGDKLAEPGIDKIMTNRGLGATVGEKSLLQERFVKKYGKDYVDKLTPEELDQFTDGAIQQQGKGFYIRYVKPLNETQSLIRDAMLQTKDSTVPRGFMKDFVGWLRTPDETMSFDARLNRKVASYSQGLLNDLLKEEAENIRDIYSGRYTTDPLTGEKINAFKSKAQQIFDKNFGGANKRWADWERVVDAGRYLYDPDTGKTGYWYKTPAEFEKWFLKANGYMPDAMQTHAYMAFKRIYEADRMFRNILLYRGASRVGAETHTISALGADGERVKADKFAGVLHDRMPGGTDNFLIMTRDLGGASIEQGGSIAPSRLEKIKQGITTGQYRVIEVYNPELRPLRGFDNVGSERIRYVVVPTSAHQIEPLTMDMLPRRGGGHVVYDYDHYIKQAIVRPENIKGNFRYWYEGDNTIMPISNRAMGQKMAKALEQVRLYLLDKDEANAARYTKAHLPMQWEEVRKWFLGGKDLAGNTIEPRLNLSEPIQVVPRGKNISQMDNSMWDRYRDANGNRTIEDGTRKGSLARQHQVDFTQERDADMVYTATDVGNKYNPVWKYEPAKMMDVMPTLTRAINAISNSMFMDDYKTFAVERWIRRAADHLNMRGDPKTELQKAPYYHFYNHEYLAGTDYLTKKSLQQEHYKIQSFVGQRSAIDDFLYSMSSKVADATYNALGPGKTSIGRMARMILPGAIKYSAQPFRILQQAAFHGALGLGNIAQVMAQSMTYASILAVSGGSRAGPGTMAAFLHQTARLAPYLIKNGYKETDLLNVLDRVASHQSLNVIPGTVKFKPGEFTEAYQALKRTGFDLVGAEHSMLERVYSPKVVSNGFQNFLDGSSIFFKGAERNGRFGAWYTAYLEFRERNPTGTLSNRDIQGILERADILAGNMSRASKSILQSGPLAFPAQFLGYQLRMMELFTGSRLSEQSSGAAMARLRWLATFGGLFGFTNAAGVVGFPAGDMIKKYALENGYVIGDSFIKDMMVDGFPSAGLALVTGTHYNVGQRYGVPGFDMLRDSLVSDKPFLSILQGAGGSVVTNTWAETSPIRRFMGDILTGSNKVYPLRPEDLIRPITTNISSANKFNQVVEAINTGNWMSKNAQLLQSDVSWQKAVFMGVTGLQDQNLADAYTKSLSLATRKANEEYVEKEFTKLYHRYLYSLRDNDPSAAEDYARQGQSVIERYGYPLEKRDQLMSQASKGYEDLVSRLDQAFYTRNTPTEKPAYSQFTTPSNQTNQQMLMDAYSRTLRNKQKAQ